MWTAGDFFHKIYWHPPMTIQKLIKRIRPPVLVMKLTFCPQISLRIFLRNSSPTIKFSNGERMWWDCPDFFLGLFLTRFSKVSRKVCFGSKSFPHPTSSLSVFPECPFCNHQFHILRYNQQAIS